MKMNEAQRRLTKIINANSDGGEFRPRDLYSMASDNGVSVADARSLLRMCDNVSHGIYNITSVFSEIDQKEVVMNETVDEALPQNSVESVFVPDTDKNFVKWGHFKDVVGIINSRQFCPIFITGHSGNGKTMMVEQACAATKREYMRVQISPETDEDDLIGGFRLVNGQTVFSDGPVIRAMRAGAILLVDEVDRTSNRIMCLQGVLEGKPILIKKTGELVAPAPGFNVIATANTKGKGSEDGRYIAAAIIDDAFLERFTLTMEQPYPTSSVEKRILGKHMKHYNCVDVDFAEKLCLWSESIRKTFEDGAGLEDMISTRRLCHIIQVFSIFNDRKKAVGMCVSRFDEDTKAAFLDLYSKIDAPEAKDDEIPVGSVADTFETDEFVKSAKGWLSNNLSTP